MREPKQLILCSVCGKHEGKSGIAGVGQDCYKVAYDKAREGQETDYLAAYLSSRVDERGQPLEDSALCATKYDRKQIARLVRTARKLRVDWRVPPPRMSFELRVRNALGLGRSEKGRKKQSA